MIFLDMLSFAEAKMAKPDEFFCGEKNEERIKETFVYMIFNFDLGGDDFFTISNRFKFLDLMCIVDEIDREDFWHNAKNSKNTSFSGEDIFYLVYVSHKLTEQENFAPYLGEDSMALACHLE